MRRFFPPLVVLTLAACFGMTAWVAWGGATFAKAGAIREYSIWRGEYWRFVTAIFLHMPWRHLVINALGIVLLGASIVRGLGARTFLVAVFCGSWAAFALSMLCNAEDPYRVGISGGLTAMLGVVVAIEWRNCDGRLGKFLRSRTMITLLIVIAASALLTMWMAGESARPDHTGHLAGFVFGILWGLMRYPRLHADGSDTPERPLRGAVAIILFSLAPAAYASYPIHDVGFCVFKARRAFQAGQERTAISWYERAHDREPDLLEPRLNLAGLKNDLSYLKGLSPRLPDEQRDLVDVYFRVTAQLAAQGKSGASFEMDEAMFELAKTAQWNPRQRWRLAQRVIVGLVGRTRDPDRTSAQRLVDMTVLVETAVEAAGALGEDSGQDESVKAAVRKWLAGILKDARAMTYVAAAATPADAPAPRFSPARPAPPSNLRELQSAIARAYRRLANNPGETVLAVVAAWRYHFAEFTYLATGEAKDAHPFMVAALQDARAGGNEQVQLLATQWLKAVGFSVPPPDLADPDDDR